MNESVENMLRGEFIGKTVEVKSMGLKGTIIKGTIIDESKNMLVVKTGNIKKKVVKNGNIFLFNLDNCKIRVKGALITQRPEDRIKMKLPRKWKQGILA